MNEEPLQVYLDSSDFSDLSKADKRAELLEVESQLLALQEKRAIDLRFSFIHILEAAPRAPADVQNALARVACIYRLCGQRTLLAQDEVFAREVAALVDVVPFDRSGIYDDKGNWMPDSIGKSIALPEISEGMVEAISTIHGNRQLRRQLKKRYVGRNGTWRSRTPVGFAEQIPTLVAEFSRNYPMSDDCKRTLREYYLGQASAAQLEEAILGSIRDIRLFMSWYGMDWNSVSPLLSWFRREGNRIHSKLRLGRQVAIDMIAAERLAGTSDADIALRLSEFSDRLPMKLVNGFLAKRLTGNDMKVVDARTAARLLPGSWAAAKVASQKAATSIAAMRNQRHPDDGDFGDSLHAIYLPYVDIFRCDTQTRGQIATMKLPYATTIVGNLHELPEQIRQRLDRR